MMRIKLGLLVWMLFIGCIAWPAKADIYTYVDENGVRHYSNVPTSARYRYESPEMGFDTAVHGSPDRFDSYIRTAASSYGLEFSLVKAIVCVESNFNPTAVSRAGAIGLMQIMPANFKDFQLHDPYNPRANIIAGARYFKSLLNRFGNNLKLSLAAYNAGPATVERFNGVPPYAETQNYINQVMAQYSRFKKSESGS